MSRNLPKTYSFERQLAHSEERLKLLVESVSDYAIFMLDPDGIVASWNSGAENITGYAASEIIGQHFSVFYTDEDLQLRKPERELETAISVGRFEEEGWRLRKDGSRYWASAVLTPVLEEGILRGFAKVVRDITDTRQFQNSEERFKLLVDSVKEYAIFMLDPEGRVSSWNPGAQRIKGYAAKDILGHHFSRFYLEEDIQSGKPQRELEIAIAEGKYEEEGWRLRKDGTKFWANVVITPVRDFKGVLQGFSKVTRDMTSRRETDEQLRDLNRQLEAFAYSVAHDLRQPLRAIAFTSRMVLDDAGPELNPENRGLLETQVRSAMKLAQIVNDLLNLSRISRAEMVYERIDISELARQVAEEMLASERPCVIDIDVQEGLIAFGDRTLITTVLQNLFDNACKFSPEGGRVYFGQELSEGTLAFVVRDWGVGFPMEYAHKIFLPFERLVKEEQFEGTGIGLANVQRAVLRHGGRVWAESEPGKGSSFYFTLGK